MPETDMSSAVVVGAKSGHIRATKTWILGRFLRDEDYRVDRDMKREQSHQHPDAPSCDVQTGPVPSASAGTARPAWEALRITVYRFNENPPVPHGEPTLDRAWYFGIVVIAIELVIAAIPWILYRQSMTFVVAAAGNLLAVVGGSLSQWKVEKWPAPRRCGDTITLTQGNGSRHAVLIVGQKGVGLDMEILARGTRACPPSWDVKAINVVLTLLWICILVTVAGMKENTHCKLPKNSTPCYAHVRTAYNDSDLLIIGLIGSIQNLHAAGSIRTPSSQGIHLIYEQTIRGDRVAKVLRAAEEQYPMVGTSLLSVFFPGGLRAKDPEEIKFWRDAQRLRTARTQHGVRVDLPGSSDDIGSGVEREEELRHKGSEDSQGVQETIVHHDYLATQ